jgi:hypothetical protein
MHPGRLARSGLRLRMTLSGPPHNPSMVWINPFLTYGPFVVTTTTTSRTLRWAVGQSREVLSQMEVAQTSPVGEPSVATLLHGILWLVFHSPLEGLDIHNNGHTPIQASIIPLSAQHSAETENRAKSPDVSRSQEYLHHRTHSDISGTFARASFSRRNSGVLAHTGAPQIYYESFARDTLRNDAEVWFQAYINPAVLLLPSFHHSHRILTLKQQCLV